MNTLEKLLSIFLIVMGISIISVWSMLLITGQVSDIKINIISLLFHWTSELLLSLISILTGLVILFNKNRGQSSIFSIFFALGLALSSTFNAVSYYFFTDFNLTFIIITGSFFIISLFFLIFSFIRFDIQNIKNSFLYKFGIFNLGLLLYLMLNIAGNLCQTKKWSGFISLVFLIAVDVYYSFILIKNKGEKK